MSVLGLIVCPDCKKERLKHYDPYKYPDKTIRCIPCKMKGNNCGHREIHKKGRAGRNKEYIKVWINKDDFFYPMKQTQTNKKTYGYVLEHRLVMAKFLYRCLQRWEIVHHKNGIKDDNRIENLELTTIGEHIKDHSRGYKGGYRKGLTDGRLKQIELLKEEIRRLRND